MKFIRQESRVLWGKCWNKTPSEEVLELKGIKLGGDIVLNYSPAVTGIEWVLKTTFFILQIGQGMGRAFPTHQVGSSAIILYDFLNQLILWNCMLCL